MTSAAIAPDRVLVIGAGIGGLAAAARLAHAGMAVTVLDRHAAPGGKMRTLSSAAGPVDAGPTVLTMRPVFDALFAALGERLDDHLHLIRQTVLARHFWPDGSRLDLHDNETASAEAIRAFAGPRAADEFRAFSSRARTLFRAFDGPVMQAPHPSLGALTARMLRQPGLLHSMAPQASLATLLDRAFTDPRLAQLFGRYATYVGGSPYRTPALLSLIWEAEATGVWAVEGGMHRLARTIAALATARGAEFRYETDVARIHATEGAATGVTLTDGTRLRARHILFNGDPRALATGAMGPDGTAVAPQTRKVPRSLSAEVWAFAARAEGPSLALHNVFFRDDPKPEFGALARGERVPDPTLYVCAMDRARGTLPPGPERFEIIANAPPLTDSGAQPEATECRTRTFDTLAAHGLRFDPAPPDNSLTTPADFDRMFPASAGSLYGQSPHGLMAAFRRPSARTPIKGLYLAGGGTHPGAGVPMAALSGRHAAEAILSDRTSTSTSRRTATPGGISTRSAKTAAAPPASSGS